MNTNETTMADAMNALDNAIKLAEGSTDSRAVIFRRRALSVIADLRRVAGQAAAALSDMSWLEDSSKRKNFRAAEGFFRDCVKLANKSRTVQQQCDTLGTGADERPESKPWTFGLLYTTDGNPNGRSGWVEVTGSAGRRLWDLFRSAKKGEYLEPFAVRQILEVVESAQVPGSHCRGRGESVFLTVKKEREDKVMGRTVGVSYDTDEYGNVTGVRMVNPAENKGMTEREATFSVPSSEPTEPTEVTEAPTDAGTVAPAEPTEAPAEVATAPAEVVEVTAEGKGKRRKAKA